VNPEIQAMNDTHLFEKDLIGYNFFGCFEIDGDETISFFFGVLIILKETKKKRRQDSLGRCDVLGDGNEFRSRFRGDSRLGLSIGRTVRLLEKPTGARCTFGSGLLRVDSFSGRYRGWTHVGAPFAKGRLGFRRGGGSESALVLRDRLGRRFDSKVGLRCLDCDGFCRVLGIS